MVKTGFEEQIDELTATLDNMRPAAMRAAGYTTFTANTVASFHARIGSNNNTYVDAVREVFLSPEQFISEWKQGALDAAVARDEQDKTWGNSPRQNYPPHRTLAYLNDPVIAEYIDLFLERNFYRQYYARVRTKPEFALWELWFGPKNQEYGLFITPRYRDDKWENDVSHIRRSDFEYWTIGHVITSGFIVPNTERIHPVPTLDALFALYQNVFMRTTNSQYSQAFGMEYEKHVRAAADPLVVPFMIPELRYEGATGTHEHRLDFTILSVTDGSKVGIELSPWSTHMQVRGVTALRAAGGQQAVDAQQKKQWEADIEKRNKYFLKYGINVLTFTDDQLQDTATAFQRVAKYLIPKPTARVSTPAVQNAIRNYKFAKPYSPKDWT